MTYVVRSSVGQEVDGGDACLAAGRGPGHAHVRSEPRADDRAPNAAETRAEALSTAALGRVWARLAIRNHIKLTNINIYTIYILHIYYSYTES